MRKRNFAIEPKAASVEENLCIACGKCVQSCAYQALYLKDVAKVDEERCFGCGLCVTRCPKKAISLR